MKIGEGKRERSYSVVMSNGNPWSLVHTIVSNKELLTQSLAKYPKEAGNVTKLFPPKPATKCVSPVFKPAS